MNADGRVTDDLAAQEEAMDEFIGFEGTCECGAGGLVFRLYGRILCRDCLSAETDEEWEITNGVARPFREEDDWMSTVERKLLTVDEARQALRVSKSLLYALVKKGKIQAVRIGLGRGKILVEESEVERFLKSCQQESTR